MEHLINNSSFVSSEDIHKKGVMHSEGNSIGIMICDKADEVMEELLEILLNRYQTHLWLC